MNSIIDNLLLSSPSPWFNENKTVATHQMIEAQGLIPELIGLL